MVDEPVLLERGVLTASPEVWALAVRRAEVFGQLAGGATVGHRAVDAAAAELGVSRRQVYALLARWRTGAGVVSDLIPGRSPGGRGREHLPEPVETVIREVLRSKYVSRQRQSLAAVHREVARRCRAQGLRVPSRGTLTLRAARLDPVATTMTRHGPDAGSCTPSRDRCRTDRQRGLSPRPDQREPLPSSLESSRGRPLRACSNRRA
jgi:putative transposase